MDLATRFYLADQKQADIARALSLDPSTVSRYLQRARDEGIVRIEIQRPRSHNDDLAVELAEAFGLRRAIVVDGRSGPASLDAVARAAAEHVTSQLLNRICIGLSWGRMLAATVEAMSPGVVSHLEVTMLNGGVATAGTAIQGHELVRHLGSLYPQSHVHYLHAPVLVDSPSIKQAMLSDRTIRTALKAGAGCDVALVGIGTLDASAPLIRYGHISPRDRDRLVKAGAVGDTCARFFTPEGEPVTVLDDRLIAVEWGQLKRVPNVVAVAAGADKRDAIVGALRSGLIGTLITDEQTTKEVLRAARRSS